MAARRGFEQASRHLLLWNEPAGPRDIRHDQGRDPDLDRFPGRPEANDVHRIILLVTLTASLAFAGCFKQQDGRDGTSTTSTLTTYSAHQWVLPPRPAKTVYSEGECYEGICVLGPSSPDYQFFLGRYGLHEVMSGNYVEHMAGPTIGRMEEGYMAWRTGDRVFQEASGDWFERYWVLAFDVPGNQLHVLAAQNRSAYPEFESWVGQDAILRILEQGEDYQNAPLRLAVWNRSTDHLELVARPDIKTDYIWGYRPTWMLLELRESDGTHGRIWAHNLETHRDVIVGPTTEINDHSLGQSHVYYVTADREAVFDLDLETTLAQRIDLPVKSGIYLTRWDDNFWVYGIEENGTGASLSLEPSSGTFERIARPNGLCESQLTISGDWWVVVCRLNKDKPGDACFAYNLFTQEKITLGDTNLRVERCTTDGRYVLLEARNSEGLWPDEQEHRIFSYELPS
jgi:hypothetical protein